jgi:hypothetical protein
MMWVEFPPMNYCGCRRVSKYWWLSVRCSAAGRFATMKTASFLREHKPDRQIRTWRVVQVHLAA